MHTPPPHELGKLTLAHFKPYFGQSFEALACDGGVVRLILVRGTEKPQAAGPKATRVPFSLIFRGPSEDLRLAGDGGYTLRHADGWSLDGVLISPVLAPGEDEPGIYYQCLFG